MALIGVQRAYLVKTGRLTLWEGRGHLLGERLKGVMTAKANLCSKGLDEECFTPRSISTVTDRYRK